MADQRRNTDGSVEAIDATAESKEAKAQAKAERDKEIKEVRASDIEPYTGLRYLSKLFRFMSVILVLLLVAEVATGLPALFVQHATVAGTESETGVAL